MSELYLAASEYLKEYSYKTALELLCIEFNISKHYASTVLNDVEQEEFAYCGA